MNHSSVSDGDHHHFSGTHYVVSEDVDILISRWCNSVNIFPPHEDFHFELRSKMKTFLENIFTRVTFVSSKEIRRGLLASVALHKQAGLTVVSLERTYLEDCEIDRHIELTRTVDSYGEDVLIPSPREGTPVRHIQFEALRNKKIALIDDVVFSGKTLISTIGELHHHNTTVHAITAAIGIKNGIDSLKKAGFGIIGQPQCMSIDCLEEFDGISDQVCERDFYPGVPYSGRQHFNGNLGSMPYTLPFGRPNKWASIPEKEVRAFSQLCIDNTILLFSEIEKINNLAISCFMVPRHIFGSPKDDTHFTSFLKSKRPV